MRQTGRTSRIVDFVVDQLYNTGQCIATDHVMFEHSHDSIHMLRHLIEKVERRLDSASAGYLKVKSVIIRANEIPMVHFRLIKNNKEE